MSCNEKNCINISCALCYDCKQSLCLKHIIIHHDTFIQRHLSFYNILQKLYKKLHSMNIEQCYRQVHEQLSSNYNYSQDTILQLRLIREELIEQLNRFKQKKFNELKNISFRLNDTHRIINDNEVDEIKMKLEQIQTSINSLVYGIHLEILKTTKQVQCRKIFHHKTSLALEMKTDLSFHNSASWTNGSTENY